MDEICPDKEPAHSELRKYLQALGPPRPFTDDKVAVLQMVNARKDRESFQTFFGESDLFNEPKQNALFTEAKELLLTVMTALPPPAVEAATGGQLLPFLEAQKEPALERKDEALPAQITNLLSMLKTLASMGLLSQGDKELTFNEYLSNFAKEIHSSSERLRHLTKRLDLIQGADQSISAHFQYLESRLELYRVYLENVKKRRHGYCAEEETQG